MIRTLSISGGDILILGGNICWALYGVLGRRYIKEGTPLSTTSYTMLVGAVALIIASLFSSNPVPVPDIPLEAWGAIAFMALFTSVLGYLWWNQGMKELGAAKTSLFFNLVPVVTMAISFVMGTPITLFQWIGAIFVISGVVAASGILAFRNMNTERQPAVK